MTLLRTGLLGPAVLSLITAAAPAQTTPKIKRFTFDIDPKTPLAELLPPAPSADWAARNWQLDDPSQAPEIFFQKTEKPAKASAGRRADEASVKRLAETMAKINLLNSTGREPYLKLLREQRKDLAGLPWIKGAACQMTPGTSAAFLDAIGRLRPSRDPRSLGEPTKAKTSGGSAEQVRAEIAALVQILGVEEVSFMSSGARTPLPKEELLQRLVEIDDREATRALARLAVYSFAGELRVGAADALKLRSSADVTDILLEGLRYPWPFAAANAAHTLADLKRVDLIPTLLAMLDEPDQLAPRAPSPGAKPRIREVVRIHHNRNCLLCHAPATPDVFDPERDKAPKVVVGPVPPSDQPLPAVYYGPSLDEYPDIFVRADVTYLRQDFSMMLPAKDSAARDGRERFDFLVREREASTDEVAGYAEWREKQGPKYVPPHHQALDTALRRLTGRDAAAPTAAAWREAAGLKR
ncbi:MAG: hypothetical protein U0793_21980 [Gemmataceae bacterium]